MAYAHRIEPGASVRLEDFSGQVVEIPLEAGLSPIQNASKFYQRAKRLEAGAEKALELEPITQTQIAALEAKLAGIERLSLEELRTQNRSIREKGPEVGLRFSSPSGYAVWVG
ncbi:NFACT family protein, partial [Candidatus Hakubella thermalkaliphila]